MSFVFSRQKPSPFKYEKLLPVIFVGMLNHIYDPTHDDVISKYAITNLKHHTIASEHTVYYLVELPKFKKTEDQLKTIVDKWLFFMQQADQFIEIPKAFAKDDTFIEAFATLESMGWSDNDWLSYYAFEDAAGRDERIELGALKRGIKQGEQQGALKEKHTSALNFLKMGLSVEKVAEGTGLSIAQVKALLKDSK